MTDILLQIGVSNVCIALALALVAWVVQRTCRFPRAAHLLWLLVLVKLVTPSIVTVPVIALPGQPVAVAMSDPNEAEAAAGPSLELADADVPATGTASSSPARGTTGPVIAWLLGSALILIGSLVRIVRFHHLPSTASEVAPAELPRVASGIAERLGLSTTPTIYTTSARVSPLVWWVGGRVRVVIPADLASEMDASQVESILAHEPAHVRRRDHMVRWIEWLACVLFLVEPRGLVGTAQPQEEARGRRRGGRDDRGRGPEENGGLPEAPQGSLSSGRALATPGPMTPRGPARGAGEQANRGQATLPGRRGP